MNKIKEVISWLQSFVPAWFQKYSWVDEAGGSIIMMIPLLLLFHPAQASNIFLVGSYVYERFFDTSTGKPGHDPMEDFGQRMVGSIVAAVLWSWIF